MEIYYIYLFIKFEIYRMNNDLSYIRNKIRNRFSRKQQSVQQLNQSKKQKNATQTLKELPNINHISQLQEQSIYFNKKKELLKEYQLPQDLNQHFKPTTQQYYHQVRKNRIPQFYSKSTNKLDTRDQRILIPFQSKYFIDLQKSKYKLSLQPFKDEIRDWLVDLIQIITSICFNHLKQSNLTEKEIKNFTAKNILLNIKQFFQGHKTIPFDKKFELMKYVNQEMNSIFKQIIWKYPQTSSKGASRRIKNKIPKLNIRENLQYDFLHKNDIKLTYNVNGDYSEEIMRVVNRLISIASDVYHPNDQTEETNYQIFTQIMEHIFNYSSIQDPSQTVNQISQLLNRKKQSKIKNSLSFDILQNQEPLLFIQRKSSVYRQITEKDYLIGQKIPSDTKLFTNQDLQGSVFKINHSSVLRILTKWASQLRDTIQNAQEKIINRLYKFKTKNGNFINLQLESKHAMAQQAYKQEIQIQNYLQYIKNQNICLQSFFVQDDYAGKHTKHDLKLGVFSAKMIETASQYTFLYLCKLINSLMAIPQIASRNAYNQTTKAILEDINLVTLRIGDLMRCKCACSQQQFLKILATLQVLSHDKPQILKLLRIKNRLDQKDNDILINFFFLNKVQCEMQLSIKGAQNSTQKAYSHFCHFIYEIIRSQFGPLSQMANIISQYDPLASKYAKQKKFCPQILEEYTLQATKKLLIQQFVQMLELMKKYDMWRYEKQPFLCNKCTRLSIIHNPKMFYKDPLDPKFYCTQCKLQTMTEDTRKKTYEYIYNYTFANSQNLQFFVKHIQCWDYQSFIDKMKLDQSDFCDIMDLPTLGMYIKLHKKQPILKVFNTAYQQTSNLLIFGQKTKNGQKNIFMKIPLYNDKNKRIKTFSEHLKKVYFFNFKKVKEIIKNDKLFLICSDGNCDCKKDEIYIGPFFQSNDMIQYQRDKFIENTLLNTQNIWNFHDIPLIFDKIQTHLNKLDDGKMMKIYKHTQIIFAYNCSLNSIQILSKFPNLLDLHINDNLQLTNLKGLQKCYKLKNLNCSRCSLQTINQISGLKNLEYLNISFNKKINNFEGLLKLTQLKQIFLSNTFIRNTVNLANAKKLQYLDLQDCINLYCVGSIQSEKLVFVNISGCYGLKSFNLLKQASKSLKKVNYSKLKNQSDKVKIMADFGLSTKKKMTMNQDIEEKQYILDIDALLKEISLFLQKQYQEHMNKDEAIAAEQQFMKQSN